MTTLGGVIMRTVGSGDYERLVRFFHANSVPQVIRHFHPFTLSASTARHIACDKHLDRYYVALLRGRVIALSMLRGWDKGYSTPSFGILVDRRFQGRGIGTKMTEFTISDAAALGCPQVRLSVYATNEVALHVYASLGFEEHVREPVLVMGQPDEKIVMVKDLGAARD